MSMTLEDKVKVMAAALNGDEVEYRDSGYDDIVGGRAMILRLIALIGENSASTPSQRR